MQNPRHIVLLVADSLRYDAVFGGYGHLLPYAVGHGVNFAQARSAGCWTLPATATLFTGLLPHAHGATSQSRGIRPQVPTLAERMSALDYAPSMVSANIATTEILQYHFSNVTDAGTRVPLLWLPHDHDDARTVETSISTRDLFGALLKAAGDKEEAFFCLTASPERSVSIMQSFWYDNRGRTQPRYRYNQFAFVAGTQRFVHRHGQWRAAPLTRRDDPEVAFQDLGRRVDPLREAVDRPDRLAYIRRMFEAYQAFAAGV